MLNPVLAGLAMAVWSASYAVFFRRDLRRWWRTRDLRRAWAAQRREQAIRAYQDWVRNLPPPRPRPKIKPGTVTTSRTGGVSPYAPDPRRKRS